VENSVYQALRSGGVFVFDSAEPGQVPGRTPRKDWRQGNDWAILVEVEEDRRKNVLVRRITYFRRFGKRSPPVRAVPIAARSCRVCGAKAVN
jgi:hypothetical protein